jgi:methionyl-tRNA formyltransferase
MIGYWGHYEEIINTKAIENISYFVFEKGKCPDNLLRYVIEKKIRYYFIQSHKEMFEIIKSNPVPDITLVGSFGLIFTEEMINELDDRIVNIHPGILPNYRGRHPLPQAIINQERFMGITAHRLTKQIDKGEIIDIRSTIIDYGTSYMENVDRLYSLLPDLIDYTIEKFTRKYSPKIIEDGNGKYYKPLNNEVISNIINSEKLTDIFDDKERFHEKNCD